MEEKYHPSVFLWLQHDISDSHGELLRGKKEDSFKKTKKQTNFEHRVLVHRHDA